MRLPAYVGSGAHRASFWRSATWVIVLPGLWACGMQGGPEASVQDVVARVDGVAISSRQVEEWLFDTGLGSADDPAVRRRALEALIDEQLLVRHAAESGVEHTASVQRALERARRQLLARAAVEISVSASVGGDEARAYYVANPALFGQRKVYTFRRFELAGRGLERRLKSRIDAAGRSADVGAILSAAGVPCEKSTEVRPAESLPVALLPEAARMSVGDVLMFRHAAGTTLLQLRASQLEPIGFAQARPAIESWLAAEKRDRETARLLKQLRREARIEIPAQTSRLDPSHEDHGDAMTQANAVAGEPSSQKWLQSRHTTLER